MADGAAEGLNNVSGAARKASESMDNFGISVSKTVGQVTLLEQAFSAMGRFIPTDPVRKMERAQYDLAKSFGLNAVQVDRLERNIDNLSKTTNQYSRAEIQKLAHGLQSSSTLMGLANQNAIKYTQALVKLGQGAEETSGVLEALASRSAVLDVAFAKGTVSVGNYYEAFLIGGRRGLAAISNFNRSLGGYVDDSVENLRGLDKAFTSTSTNIDNAFLKTGRSLKENVDASTVSMVTMTAKILGIGLAATVALGPISKLAFNFGKRAVGGIGQLLGGAPGTAGGKLTAGSALARVGGGAGFPIPLPVIITNIQSIGGSPLGGATTAVPQGGPPVPNVRGQFVGFDPSGKAAYRTSGGPTYAEWQGRKRGGWMPGAGAGMQAPGPGRLSKFSTFMGTPRGRMITAAGGAAAMVGGEALAGIGRENLETSPGWGTAGVIGGKALSMAGTGAMVGSVIPGIGTAAGAAVGALAGLAIGVVDATSALKELEASANDVSNTERFLAKRHAGRRVDVTTRQAEEEGKKQGLGMADIYRKQSEALIPLKKEAESQIKIEEANIDRLVKSKASYAGNEDAQRAVQQELDRSTKNLDSYRLMLDEANKKQVEFFGAGKRAAEAKEQ